MSDRTVSVRLDLIVGAWQRQAAVAQKAIRDIRGEVVTLSNATGKAGGDMRDLGRHVLVAGTGMALGLGLAVKAAVDFESAFAGVRKTVAGTDAELEEIRQGIREMATEMPASATEIAAVAQAAGALGVATPDVLDFTRNMVMLGEATDDLSAEQAATGMARFMNIMRAAPGDVDELSSTLVALGNDGASTEGEILDMALRIASAARQVRASGDDVLGLANGIASLGIEAERGGSSISRSLIAMQNAVMDGGDALEAFATTAGMSTRDFAESFRADAAGTLVLFTEGLGKLQDQGVNTNRILDDLALSDIRVSDTLRAMAGSGDVVRRSLELAGSAFEANVALQREYDERVKTTAAQLEILRNELTDIGITAGEDLLPAVRFVVGVLGDLAGGAEEVLDALGPAAPVLAGVAAAAMLAGGGFLFLTPTIQAANRSIVALSTTAPVAATALRGLLLAGGVVTAALAVASIAVAAFGDDSKEAAGDSREFADALDQQARGARNAVDALVAKKIVDADLDAAARRLGVSIDLVRDAILGEDGALHELATSMGGVAVMNGELVDGYTGLSDEAANLVDAIVGLNGQYEEASGTGSRVVDVQRSLGAATDDQRNAVEAAEKALSDYNDELDRILGRAFSVEEAQDRVTESLRDWATEVEEAKAEGDKFATSLDATSDAGLRNREHLRGLADDALFVARAMTEQGASTGDVAAMMAAYRQQIINTAIQMGFNAAEATRYTDVLLQIPKNISTNVQANTGQAITAVDAYIHKLYELDTVQSRVLAGNLALARNRGYDVTPQVPDALPPLPPIDLGPIRSGAQTRAANSGGGGGTSDAQRMLDEARENAERLERTRRQVTDNAFKLGLYAFDDYIEELRRRRDAEEFLTEGWMEQNDLIEKIFEERAQLMLDAQQKIRDAEDIQFAEGRISTDRYLEILRERHAGVVRAHGYDVEEAHRIREEIRRIEQGRIDDQEDAAREAEEKREEAIDRLRRLIDDERDLRARLVEVEKEYRQRVADLQQAFVDEQQQVLDDRRRQLVESLSIEERFVAGWGNSAGALARNTRDQIAAFDEWTDTLNALRSRGLSEAVIDMLGLAEGPQALGQVRALASATEAEIADLNAAVAARYAQSADQVGREQAQSFSKVSETLVAIAERHAAEVEKLTEEFLADQAKLNDDLAALGTEHGLTYAQALEAGLRSSIPAIAEAARAAQEAMMGVTAPASSGAPPPGARWLYGGDGTGRDGHGMYRMPDGTFRRFHAGISSVPGPVGADFPATVAGGERIFSVPDNRALIAAVQAMGGPPSIDVLVLVGDKPVEDMVVTVLDKRSGLRTVVGAK